MRSDFRLLSRSVTRSTDEAVSLSVVGSLTSHTADPHALEPFPVEGEGSAAKVSFGWKADIRVLPTDDWGMGAEGSKATLR